MKQQPKRAPKPKFMFAYGANTNREHMRFRAEGAQYLGNARVLDYRLVFRSVADIIPAPGHQVMGAVWMISSADEVLLDKFESYPRLYRKAFFDMPLRGKMRKLMAYVMNGERDDFYEPPYAYEWAIREGYEQCGLPQQQVDEAIKHAEDSNMRRSVYQGKWLEVNRQIASALLPKPKPRPIAMAKQMEFPTFKTKEQQLQYLEQRMFGHWIPKDIRSMEEL